MLLRTCIIILKFDNNMVNYINDAISELKTMEELWLHFNRIKKLPKGIGELKNMTVE